MSAEAQAEALARVESFLERWAPYRGGVALATRSGAYLLLKDVRTLAALVREQGER